MGAPNCSSLEESHSSRKTRLSIKIQWKPDKKKYDVLCIIRSEKCWKALVVFQRHWVHNSLIEGRRESKATLAKQCNPHRSMRLVCLLVLPVCCLCLFVYLLQAPESLAEKHHYSRRNDPYKACRELQLLYPTTRESRGDLKV